MIAHNKYPVPLRNSIAVVVMGENPHWIIYAQRQSAARLFL